jgi:two-component system, OmpR family, phosphate regulon sensor histidine kinase PhoR
MMILISPKNPTPQLLAFITALNQAVATHIVLTLLKFIFPDSIHWWMLGLSFILQLSLSTLFFNEALKRFIYNKVKLIYKSIHSIKAPKSSPPIQIDLNTHIMDKVEKEVTEWAKDWTQEIRYMKKTEQFRKEFIDNVSHELKTPIFNIQGYLYTLIEGGMDDHEIAEKYLQRAIDNVDRIAEIVQELNQISKFETGGVQLDIKRFNIDDLAEEVIADMELSAERKKISLELKEHAHKAYWVNADPDMIRQVLVNLISNSIKYGREGGKTLIGFYDLDKNILVEISDTGKGIAQEHLPRLFERFYRVDKGRSRDEGGTGLGLSIVKHIIEAHNQTINVRSRLGVGSTFGFTLEKAKKTV